MPFLIKTGKLLLATSVTAFGIEQFLFHHPLTAFIPSDFSVQKQLIIAVVSGILFIAAGVRIGLQMRDKYAAWFPGILFLLIFVLFHLTVLIKDLHNGSEWTVCFELVTIASGATLAVIFPLHESSKLRWGYKNRWLRLARFSIGISFIVFSLLHFIYADFIATLIPAWIPFPLFWSYFFGVAFLAAAVSILINKLVSLSAFLLAIVFFVWVMVLHLPRCLKTPGSEPEWTSLFTALAIGATALILSGVSNYQKKYSQNIIL